MTSGLDSTENDNPFEIHSRSYQRAKIKKTILSFKLKDVPGKNVCCLSETAGDFVKFGRLYLNKANWNGGQIIVAVPTMPLQ